MDFYSRLPHHCSPELRWHVWSPSILGSSSTRRQLSLLKLHPQSHGRGPTGRRTRRPLQNTYNQGRSMRVEWTASRAGRSGVQESTPGYASRAPKIKYRVDRQRDEKFLFFTWQMKCYWIVCYLCAKQIPNFEPVHQYASMNSCINRRIRQTS